MVIGPEAGLRCVPGSFETGGENDAKAAGPGSVTERNAMRLHTRPHRACALSGLAAAALMLVSCTGADEPDQQPAPTGTPVPSPSLAQTETQSPEPSQAPSTATSESTAGATSEAEQGVPPQPEAPLPSEEPTDEAPFVADLETDTQQASEDARLSPTGMRFGVHGDFDRLVIDLSGSGRPGWTAEYTETPIQQGSGREVDLAGNAALAIQIDGVMLPTEEGAEPWEGPEELSPRSAGVVEQVIHGPLFEGTQQIFVGLTSAEPFRVFALEDPTRVVIDVQHP